MSATQASVKQGIKTRVETKREEVLLHIEPYHFGRLQALLVCVYRSIW